MNKRKPLDLVSLRNDPEFYFRIGQKYVKKKRLGTALKFINRAVDIEPYNADYQFNFACLLAELKQLKKSNDILLGILKNIDPKLTECYFGIGCNYFDLADFKKAREYFEKYVYFDPDGQFADEAYDVLNYLQVYEDTGAEDQKGATVTRLIRDARKLLDEGSYRKACSKLEKALEIYPELVSARNDLSMAYFHCGELEKAVSLAKSVLILEPKNVWALCNLTRFYHHMKKTELCDRQLKALSRLRVNGRDELAKLLQTYILLKKHAAIARVLITYLKDKREFDLLHMLSTAFYNLKQYQCAEEILQAIKDFFPQYALITDYYSKINAATKNGTIKHSELDYSGRLPEALEAQYRDMLLSYMRLETAVFQKIWSKDAQARSIILYFMYKGNHETRVEIIGKLMEARCENTRNLIDEFSGEEDDIGGKTGRSSELLRLQELIGEHGRLSDASLPPGAGGVKMDQPVKWHKEWNSVIDCAVDNREVIYQGNYRRELKSIWTRIAAKLAEKHALSIVKVEVWAAVLEYIYCTLHLVRVTRKRLAEKYGISPSSITAKLKLLDC